MIKYWLLIKGWWPHCWAYLRYVGHYKYLQRGRWLRRSWQGRFGFWQTVGPQLRTSQLLPVSQWSWSFCYHPVLILSLFCISWTLSSLNSSGQLDFSDPKSVQQLTKSLLKRDFGLKLILPDDRLCPPVSQPTVSCFKHVYFLCILMVEGTQSVELYSLVTRSCRHIKWYIYGFSQSWSTSSWARYWYRSKLHISALRLYSTSSMEIYWNRFVPMFCKHK